jgi:mannose-6-phosphate isomerase-like protein (cupin superfamily)
MDNLHPYTEKRPWGEFTQFTHNQVSTVKILKVLPGEAFSLQYHHHRDEFWHILSGTGFITVGENRESIKVNQDYFIPRETDHRLEATTDTIVALEISLGDFDEEDIVRKEDKYNRNTQK